jgi:hypothetical protein
MICHLVLAKEALSGTQEGFELARKFFALSFCFRIPGFGQTHLQMIYAKALEFIKCRGRR